MARALPQADAVGPDPRIELISILFHLADAPEYSTNKFPAYSSAVDKYFSGMRNHPAVVATRELRQKYRIGYFHPMNLAVHLTMPPALAERTAFDKPGHALGSRWPADATRGYLEQVRVFYKEARVEEFFKQQAPLYESTSGRLRELLRKEGDPKWFEQYFGGAASTKFFVVPSLLNGGAQYGATYRDGAGAEEAYAVMGIYKLDEAGGARFDREDSDNVVHEFAHTLTNRAVSAQLSSLDKAGPALFGPVREQMRQQGYGEWQTMLYEAVVRAVVVRFIAAHRGEAEAKKEIEEQHKLGFGVTGELAALLGKYDVSRTQHPRFADYMPRIIALLQEAATRPPAVK